VSPLASEGGTALYAAPQSRAVRGWAEGARCLSQLWGTPAPSCDPFLAVFRLGLPGVL